MKRSKSVNLIKIKNANISNVDKVVFTVPLPNSESVFMSSNVCDSEDELYGVVIVDSKKFLELWRADPQGIHAELSNGSPKTWPLDYKYKDAEVGFADGEVNPVPLANVSLNTVEKANVSYKFLNFGKKINYEVINYIAFTNGLTRTIWLLTQGCDTFPVLCNISSAKKLFDLGAAKNTLFYTQSEISKLPKLYRSYE